MRTGHFVYSPFVVYSVFATNASSIDHSKTAASSMLDMQPVMCYIGSELLSALISS